MGYMGILLPKAIFYLFKRDDKQNPTREGLHPLTARLTFGKLGMEEWILIVVPI